MEDNYYDPADKKFFEFAQKLTDRQLLEKQVHYRYLQNENTKNIMKYVAFFFWLFIVGVAISILIFVFSM